MLFRSTVNLEKTDAMIIGEKALKKLQIGRFPVVCVERVSDSTLYFVRSMTSDVMIIVIIIIFNNDDFI